MAIRFAPKDEPKKPAKAKTVIRTDPETAKKVVAHAREVLRKAEETKPSGPKKAISIRLDADVIEGFKSTGAGWMSQINNVLRRHLGL